MLYGFYALYHQHKECRCSGRKLEQLFPWTMARISRCESTKELWKFTRGSCQRFRIWRLNQNRADFYAITKDGKAIDGISRSRFFTWKRKQTPRITFSEVLAIPHPNELEKMEFYAVQKKDQTCLWIGKHKTQWNKFEIMNGNGSCMCNGTIFYVKKF